MPKPKQDREPRPSEAPAGEPEAPVGPAVAEQAAAPVANAETPDAAAPGADGPQAEPTAPDADAPEPAPSEPDLDALSAERDSYLALAQRTQADFENYRRRMTREVASVEARGVARLAKELMPALDNLSRALAAVDTREHDSGEHQHLSEGIRLVHAELLAALGRVGIECYSPRGEPFDPQLHEAMAQQPVADAQAGTIVEVYQDGYRLDGHVLRPARVVVAA